ncbi:5-formyltetrahydrofolate cyclo-ligase [Panus rudis PR-1116 ss-1]|nr:5-formyltetrahydrofolate cyclo-ligase [Panus rudis PR-1116 ss-1]
MASVASLQSNKKALRKAISAVLRSLSPSDIQAQSSAITRHILTSPFFQSSKNVSCYLSMPTGEVDTSSLIEEILRHGKTLFVPKIDVTTDGKMDFLRIHDEDDLNSLPSGVWDIKEPHYERQGKPRSNALEPSAEPLDLILLPGVAFDRSLSRLGHGKGYYDRFINTYASLHGGRTPLLVALALREQILEAGEVPMGEYDRKVDVIVGPDGILQGQSGAGPSSE